MLGDDGAVTLKKGSNYQGWNDDTSNAWNVVAAKNNSSNFQVLFEGTASNNGKHQVWTTNSDGIYSSTTGWLTNAQIASAGYESVFNLDINENGSIGS